MRCRASADLTVSSLTAQSCVSSPSIRATDIDFLGSALTIKSGSTYVTSMSASTGNILNIKDIIGVNNILGSGVFFCGNKRALLLYASVRNHIPTTNSTIEPMNLHRPGQHHIIGNRNDGNRRNNY